MKIQLMPPRVETHTQHLCFHTGWVWDDLYLLLDAESDQITEQIIVFDFSQIVKLPDGLIYHCPRILERFPDHVEKCIVISRGNMMQHIHQIVDKMSKGTDAVELIFTSDLEDVLLQKSY
ncbi:MAG: hypothetical protein ACPG7F_12300 [Aggregatilineales bacterium]